LLSRLVFGQIAQFGGILIKFNFSTAAVRVPLALIRRHCGSHLRVPHRFYKGAASRYRLPLRGQQKRDCLAFVVDRPIQMLSDTLDLDVRFVHMPAVGRGTFVMAKDFSAAGKTGWPSD
jgi:hypothetical protein